MMLRSSDNGNGSIDNDAEDPTNPSDLTSDDDEEILDPVKSGNTLQPSSSKSDAPTFKRVRGRRGLLEGLTGIPLDVLFEIFSHLNPFDVLQLARTTKTLRNILMRRSSTSIWKRTLANIEGLPDCPDDLNEPQWTNLLFDSLCHYCWKNRTSNIVWTNRTRCCKKCIPGNFSDSLTYSDLPRELVPSMSSKAGAWTRERYCLRTAAEYAKEYMVLTDQAKEAWRAEKQVKIQVRKQHAKLCESWDRNRTAESTSDLADVRQRRYASIKQKLTALGWGAELEKLRSRKLSHHKLVRQAKDLSERGWNTIQPVLVALMDEIRAERIAAEHRHARTQRQALLSTIHEEYVASQPLHAIIPGFADLVEMEKFKAIIEDTSIGHAMKGHFQEAMSELPLLIEIWRNSKDKELLEMMRSSPYVSSAATESMLGLATTFFACATCLAEVQYPRILIHSCTTSLRHTENKSSPYFFDLGCETWNYGGNRVSFHSAAHRVSRDLLKACGFDPDTTKTQDIQTVNPIIECETCSNSEEGRLVMRWPQAVTHALSHCTGQCGDEHSQCSGGCSNNASRCTGGCEDGDDADSHCAGAYDDKEPSGCGDNAAQCSGGCEDSGPEKCGDEKPSCSGDCDDAGSCCTGSPAPSDKHCPGECGDKGKRHENQFPRICGEGGPHMGLASITDEEALLVKKLEEESRGSTSSYAAHWCCVRCKKKTTLNNLRHHIRLTQNQVTEPVEAEDYVRHLDAPGTIGPVRLKYAEQSMDISMDVSSPSKCPSPCSCA